MHTALTIAGLDPSGGAGVLADVKTMSAHGVYAMGVVTALTAQNTVGVVGTETVEADFLKKQLDNIFTDIFPDAVKIGMVATAEIACVVAEKLKEYNAKNIVIDPVLASTGGMKLTDSEAINVFIETLFPIAKLVTPNIPEAEILTGLSIKNATDMELAAQTIAQKCGCSVLLKGGHMEDIENDADAINTNNCDGINTAQKNNSSDDVLVTDSGEIIWFYGKRIESKNTHGTGCALSSAIASNLANGMALVESIKSAKEYLSAAIAAGPNLGAGNGPIEHFVTMKN